MHAVSLTCPECRVRFVRGHGRQQFCTPEHSKLYNNRSLKEGQRIVGIAKAWRMGKDASDPELKKAAAEAFGQLCRELDALNRADREEGRLPALRVFRRRQVAGLLDH